MKVEIIIYRWKQNQIDIKPTYDKQNYRFRFFPTGGFLKSKLGYFFLQMTMFDNKHITSFERQEKEIVR